MTQKTPEELVAEIQFLHEEVARLKAADVARRHAEQTIAENAASFRLLFAHNPHPMWVFDRDTLQFLEVNESATALYGYSRDEFLQMQITDIGLPQDTEPLLSLLAIEHTEPNFSGEWQHQLKNEQRIDVEIVSHSLEFAGRRAMLVVAENVTARRQLQQQLLQSQKMDIIGRLASGLAHDFNNSLTAIMGFSGLAELELPFGHSVTHHLQRIQQAASHASELLHQLLAFARRQSIEPKEVDLNGLLVDADQLLRHLLRENIDLVIVPKPGLGQVRVDPIQMQQVLINLADYARSNMPDGGKLLFETDNVTLDETYRSEPVAVIPGEYVQITIHHTGLGLTREMQAHIFDPFFVGTEHDAGMHLSLATCYGVVKQSGGYIWVTSEPGNGATFTIYLPRVDATHQRGTQSPSTPFLPRGSETIVVVDDDPLVRSTAIQTLRTLGYTVLEATTSREALRFAHEYAGNIDLLLTDIVMPHMGGKDLAEQMRAMRPEICVLYITGYDDALDGEQKREAEGASFLKKPFNQITLTGKVRETLDKAKFNRS